MPLRDAEDGEAALGDRVRGLIEKRRELFDALDE